MKILEDSEIIKLGGDPENYPDIVAGWTTEDVENYMENNNIQCGSKKRNEFFDFVLDKIYTGSMSEDFDYAMEALVDMFDFDEIKGALKEGLAEK